MPLEGVVTQAQKTKTTRGPRRVVDRNAMARGVVGVAAVVERVQRVHEVVVRHVALNKPTRGPAGREGIGREGCRLWTFEGVHALSTKCRGIE